MSATERLEKIEKIEGRIFNPRNFLCLLWFTIGLAFGPSINEFARGTHPLTQIFVSAVVTFIAYAVLLGVLSMLSFFGFLAVEKHYQELSYKE
jgi:hypothetical protein